jgi:transketolase
LRDSVALGSEPALSETHRRFAAFRVRAAILDALFKTGGGHYGGSLSVVEILVSLYHARRLELASRIDRLILSKGHAAIALYAVLKEFGHINSDLRAYGSYASGLEGHPDMNATPGVHFSTGSLGQGVATGLGMALALQRQGGHVWVVLGDGECQEGAIWEAAMVASRYRCSNLHIIVDCNGAQECGWNHDPRIDSTPLPDALQKWISFGLATQILNGHDLASLESWIRWSAEAAGPNVALAQTKKGAGIRLFEQDPKRYHCIQLSLEEHTRAVAELGEADAFSQCHS